MHCLKGLKFKALQLQRHRGPRWRSRCGGSLLHPAAGLLLVFGLGLLRPGSLPQLLLHLLVHHLPNQLVQRPQCLLVLLLLASAAPPLWRRGRGSLKWKSGSLWESSPHVWNPIWRKRLRGTFWEHHVWGQLWRWGTTWNPPDAPLPHSPAHCCGTSRWSWSPPQRHSPTRWRPPSRGHNVPPGKPPVGSPGNPEEENPGEV